MKDIRPRMLRALNKQKTEQGRLWREVVLSYPGRITEAEILLWNGTQKAKVFYHDGVPNVLVCHGSGMSGQYFRLDGRKPEEELQSDIEYLRKAHTHRASRTFNEMDRLSEEMGERNDCVVKALAVAGNIGYLYAHRIMEDMGRKRRKGVPGRYLTAALKQLGRTVEHMDMERFKKGRYELYYKVPRTITTYHPTRFPKAWDKPGTFLLWVHRHVAVVKDGVLHDWSPGKSLRVKMIDQVY